MRVEPDLDLERELSRAGGWVLGMDEAGRGAWAGPLVVGVVAWRAGVVMPEGVRDSKACTRAHRLAVAEQIAAALPAGMGEVSAPEIDSVGMSAALRLGARRALEALPVLGGPAPAVILDGPFDFVPRDSAVAVGELRCVVRGDSACASVAAASIVAKSHRDELMIGAATELSSWSLEANMGYGTAAHTAAIREHGISTMHRRSWSYLARLRPDLVVPD